MPKETFWDSSSVEGDGSSPVLTVQWGEDQTHTYLNGKPFDASGIERLQGVLRRANGKDRTVNVTLQAHVDTYIDGMERAAQATRALGDEVKRTAKLRRKMKD